MYVLCGLCSHKNARQPLTHPLHRCHAHTTAIPIAGGTAQAAASAHASSAALAATLPAQRRGNTLGTCNSSLSGTNQGANSADKPPSNTAAPPPAAAAAAADKQGAQAGTLTADTGKPSAVADQVGSANPSTAGKAAEQPSPSAGDASSEQAQLELSIQQNALLLTQIDKMTQEMYRLRSSGQQQPGPHEGEHRASFHAVC